MADFADDSEETRDEGQPHPLLPLDDRIWRHPSELDKAAVYSLDPIAVRRRWLQTQPTKASAWTAGLVGALLATGLVILGTHLATALTGDSALVPTPTNTSVTATSPSDIDISPSIAAFGISIANAIRRTTGTMASVDTQIGSSQQQQLALVVDPKGLLVVPSVNVIHASSILVTLANGVEYVGQLIGNDPAAGIALIHVNGVSNIATAHFGSTATTTPNSFCLSVTSLEGVAAVGTLHTFSATPTIDRIPIHNAMTTDMNTSAIPLGSPMLNGSGRVIGLVVGTDGQRLVVSPGWNIASAIRSLIANQVLTTGDLGMSAITSSPNSGTAAGARVTVLTAGLPASDAGLQTGDVITAVDGVPISSKTELDLALRDSSPSSQLVLSVAYGTITQTVIIPAISSSSAG